jgi:signal transduction histidine kinase
MVTMDHMPAQHPSGSLKRLLLAYELALLLLVVVTGVLGGLWAYFWSQTTRESFRLGTLTDTSHQVRSDLFRQIREVTRARLMEDPAALELYRDYSRRIDQHFNGLRRHTASRPESLAVQDMQRAYRIIQHDMNNIFTDPYVVNRVVRLKILESSYEQRMVGDFEAAFVAFARLTAGQHAILERTMRRWTRLSPVLLPIPIVFAAGLVLLSRRALRRGFVQPMAEVIAGARQLSAGHLEHRLSAGGAHEMAELAETLNQMAADLAESRDAALKSERQAALGALVPVIAHNIRNPLASIRAEAQLLAHAERPAEIAEVQEAVIETVDRLGRWVTTLVSYLHPLRPHRVATEPWAIVQAAVVLLASRLQEKGIRVDERRCPEEPRVPMDVDLMEQALAGLLANAIETSPHGGRLILATARDGSECRLDIVDEGPGLPFEPEPSGLGPGPTTKRYGTGLGIPFAFKVAEAHGFRLQFSPVPEGGTRVSLYMPLGEGTAVS